jgi:hypothetical protein
VPFDPDRTYSFECDPIGIEHTLSFNIALANQRGQEVSAEHLRAIGAGNDALLDFDRESTVQRAPRRTIAGVNIRTTQRGRRLPHDERLRAQHRDAGITAGADAPPSADASTTTPFDAQADALPDASPPITPGTACTSVFRALRYPIFTAEDIRAYARRGDVKTWLGPTGEHFGLDPEAEHFAAAAEIVENLPEGTLPDGEPIYALASAGFVRVLVFRKSMNIELPTDVSDAQVRALHELERTQHDRPRYDVVDPASVFAGGFVVRYTGHDLRDAVRASRSAPSG